MLAGRARPHPADQLAVLGGLPSVARPFPPRRALGVAELAAIQQCLSFYGAGTDPGYQGAFEQRYCAAFCAMQGGGHADAVATGTAALYVAIAALELPRGSEVLCSPVTDPGTLSAIILNGLKPSLLDSEPDSFNIGPQVTGKAYAALARASAILVVHALGQAANISALMEIAKARDLKVIEDCSQSHGALHQGKPIGTFGDVAAFSTMYRKAHITSGSGGLTYAKDENVYHKLLAYADRGKPRWLNGFDDRDPRQFLFPALNLHTDEISCAIGIASLARLHETRLRRLSFVAELTGRMRDKCKACQPYGYSPDDSPFVYPIVIDPNAIDCSVIEFAEALRAEGVPLNPCYRYLACEWPWLKPHLAKDVDTPNARSIRDRSFMLYLNENYGESEAAACVNAMLKVERHFAAV